MFIWFI